MYKEVKKGNNIQLTEPKERIRIKQFVTLLLTVGGIMNDALCKELNVDECDIQEEDKLNIKFDKATMVRMHQKSQCMYKKVDGRIKKE